MIHLPKMLIIGSTARNLGKTELVCALIKKNCSENKIIGLKITNYYQDESQYHSPGKTLLNKNFTITEETDNSSKKDTSRMLQAGAYRTFRIKTLNNYLKDAINQFLQLVNNHEFQGVIICESNSIRKVVEPGLFIMIKEKSRTQICVRDKNSAIDVKKYVDKFIELDEKSHKIDLDSELKQIVLINEKWNLLSY